MSAPARSCLLLDAATQTLCSARKAQHTSAETSCATHLLALEIRRRVGVHRISLLVARPKILSRISRKKKRRCMALSVLLPLDSARGAGRRCQQDISAGRGLGVNKRNVSSQWPSCNGPVGRRWATASTGIPSACRAVWLPLPLPQFNLTALPLHAGVYAPPALVLIRPLSHPTRTQPGRHPEKTQGPFRSSGFLRQCIVSCKRASSTQGLSN